MLRHDWRRLGISAEEVREFCVWRNAPMRVLSSAGTCELDHVVPVRQAFAGSVQTLQALCGDCHSEKTLRESAEPRGADVRKGRGALQAQRAGGVEPVDGVLPDLGFVEGCCDARQSCLNLLPYVGPGWYPLAAMLDLSVCRWDHIVLGISARSHVTRRRCGARWSAWTPRGPKARSTWPSSA